MFSDHDETSPSIAAVSAPPVACSILAVQQRKRLCRQCVDVSAALLVQRDISILQQRQFKQRADNDDDADDDNDDDD